MKYVKIKETTHPGGLFAVGIFCKVFILRQWNRP